MSNKTKNIKNLQIAITTDKYKQETLSKGQKMKFQQKQSS